MNRRLAATLAVATLGIVPIADASTPRTPARVQVSADEFSLALSRSKLRAGPAIVELVNYGEDDHDLALRRVGGTRTYRVGIVHPSGTGEFETRLQPGRYRLWCTLGDHRAKGMAATLTVVRAG